MSDVCGAAAAAARRREVPLCLATRDSPPPHDEKDAPGARQGEVISLYGRPTFKLHFPFKSNNKLSKNMLPFSKFVNDC